MALDRLASPERAPRQDRLPPQLIIRGSTAQHGSTAVSAAS
jgi:DNA-binding LacI/PurR family transcriptional regulator